MLEPPNFQRTERPMPKSDNRRKKAKLNAPKKRVFRAKVSETDGDRPKM